MSRKEFLAQLERLLSDIPQAERSEAMSYYENYFEDAGSENEAQIIEELGSPQKVADSIKKDLFGENYRDYDHMSQEQQEILKKQKQENKTLRNILIAVIIVFTFPIWIGILGAAFGVVIGVLAAIFGVSIAVIAIVASSLILGLVMSVMGVVKAIAGFPALGLVVVALGMLMLALGMLGLIVIVWFVGKILPWLIRAIVGLCKKPFQKRGAAI